MVRRNGSWLATPGSKVSSYVDTNPPAGATYVLKSWGANGTTTETCTTGPATPPPATGCAVTEVVCTRARANSRSSRIRGAHKLGRPVSGWNTPGYYDAVRRSDANLQALITELDRVGILDQTTIIVTSDHGGPAGSDSHRDARVAANSTVPFVVYGADTGTGVDLYAINPTRFDPGTSSINKSGPQPVRGHAAGNLALDLLGLPAIPGSVVNADHSLRVK